MKVAVLGLGLIGSRVALNLRGREEFEVAAWNRTAGKIDCQAASVAEAVGGADVVQLFLRDREAVRAVVGEMAGAGPLDLLNHATIDLETTEWLAGFCAEHGWGFLDAPFTGSRDAAAAGALVYYVAGPEELICCREPLLLASGRQVIRCGTPGSATVLKLVTNLVSACTVQALAEALAITRRQGLDPQTLIAAIESNACHSKLAGMKLPTMAAADFDTHFSARNMFKDSRYALELAEDLDTPAIRLVSERLRSLCDSDRADLDFSALAQLPSDS